MIAVIGTIKRKYKVVGARHLWEVDPIGKVSEGFPREVTN